MSKFIVLFLFIFILFTPGCGDDSTRIKSQADLDPLAQKVLPVFFDKTMLESISYIQGKEADDFLELWEDYTDFQIRAMAWTLPAVGRVVYLSIDVDDSTCRGIETIAEECTHLKQQETLDEAFYLRYFNEILKNGYARNHFEIEAKAFRLQAKQFARSVYLFCIEKYGQK